MKNFIVCLTTIAVLAAPSAGLTQERLTDKCRSLITLILGSMGRVYEPVSPAANEKKYRTLVVRNYGVKA